MVGMVMSGKNWRRVGAEQVDAAMTYDVFTVQCTVKQREKGGQSTNRV